MISLFDNGAFAPACQRAQGRARSQDLQAGLHAGPGAQTARCVFVHGYPYNLFGLIPTDRHLLGIVGGQGVDGIFPARHRPARPRSVLAADRGDADFAVDRSGRRRLQPDARYFARRRFRPLWRRGRYVIQRVIEVVRSIPTIPLWMGLAAALPNTWSVTQVYFAITLIISLVSWTELARVTRGRFLALREEDFVIAAELAGAGQMRIILRHMLPSFASHIIAATSLALPVMIVSETSLSFLGPRPAAAGDQLGHLAAGRPECAGAGRRAVAVERGGAGDPGDSGLQFPRRWGARCGGPLWLTRERRAPRAVGA